MRLLHLAPSSFFGGPESQILLTARSLRKAFGIDSSFLIMPKRGQDPRDNVFARKLQEAGFPVDSIVTPLHYDLLSAVRKLQDKLAEVGPDFLISYGYKADVMAWALKRLGHPALKTLAVVHGWTGANWKVRCFEWGDRKILRRFDGVIVVSESQLPHLESLKIESGRKFFVPNAISLDDLPPPRGKDEVRRIFSIPASARLLGTVGRLSPEKSQITLIEAFELLPDQFDDWHLLIVGDGPEAARIKARAAVSPAKDRIHLAGFQDDGGRWVGALDLFALPSLTEALPIVILEAMAYGVPVVSTRVGAIAALIRDDDTGWSVPPGQPEALAHALEAAMTLPGKAKDQAARAFGLLKDKFTAARQAERWNEILTKFPAARS